MAVTVKSLYKNGAFLYKMDLLAGRGGLANPVKWVHIIEDDAVSPFLHGNELVFTAGILNRQEGWLLSFAQKLREAGASAFVVNLGPHTMEVTENVRRYCDEVDLPLFTIPWETRMVDMTRDFCHRIIQAEQRESTIMTTMKNILFRVGDIEAQVLQMERFGFQRDSQYCFACIRAGDGGRLEPDELQSAMKALIEHAMRNINGQFTTFTYKEFRVVALANCSQSEIDGFLEEFVAQAARRLGGTMLHIGVSPNQVGIYSQNVNFEKAISAMEMAQKCGDVIAHYDRLGIYKVLYAVQDKTVLRGFYQDSIGKLEQYDRENGTELTVMLRDYLELNGGLQAVAERHFVHRNTVTNQLKRIEGVTGHNPLDLNEKIMLAMGFYIKDIL